jgi:hypothetical protein
MTLKIEWSLWGENRHATLGFTEEHSCAPQPVNKNRQDEKESR